MLTDRFPIVNLNLLRDCRASNKAKFSHTWKLKVGEEHHQVLELRRRCCSQFRQAAD
jgi:hypothetical protein